MNRYKKHPELNDPTVLQIGTLPPRSTIVPALQKDIFFKNKEESEFLLSLNGAYRFCWQPEDTIPEFYKPDFDDVEWDTLEVPSMWQYHGYSKPVYPNVQYPIPFNPPYVSCPNPVGYYRKRFTAHTAPKSVLYFGGVDNAYFVWLNGTFVGFSKGSRLPAEYDVTSLLQEGENLLCVKVFTYSDATYLENQDMLLANGIFRDVMLMQIPEVSVWDYHIRTEENRILVDVDLWDGQYDGYTVSVEAAGQKQTGEAAGHTQFVFTVPDVRLWNAETPYLYPVYITVARDGIPVEIHSKKIGFVHTEIQGNRLLVNGKPITLKGICRHEHDPANGRAITVDRIARELRLIKDHNLNAIRCAHYPNHPAFYEIASELGIYVMDEGDLETHGCEVTGDQGFLSKQKLWLDAYMNRTKRMVERDKNETCIIIWSAGNEHGCGENVDLCLRYVQERLGKVPVFHTMDDPKNPLVCDFRADGYFTMASLMSYPPEGKPVILTEYGHAMGNSPGLMEDTWDYVYRNRHIIGGYLWEFKNHGFLQTDANGTPFYQYGGDFGDINHWSNFSMDGYCLSDGTPKPSLRDCKNVLSPCYTEFSDGKIKILNTNDFRPLDYIHMHWELCEDFHVLCSGEMQLPPVQPYAWEELSIDTAVTNTTPGAKYTLRMRFVDESGHEVGDKQVCLGRNPKAPYCAESVAAEVTEEDDSVWVKNSHFAVRVENGLLCYYEKDGKVLLDVPMRLNFYRAPIDNDGIEGWSRRWIDHWDNIFLPHFAFFMESQDVAEEPDCIKVSVLGKALPTARYSGFYIQLTYRIYQSGLVLTEYAAEPYGSFPDVLPRIGVTFPLAKTYDSVRWYGRGVDENYCDRKAHCNFGLYQLPIADMNFQYDVPQECGTRSDVYFASALGESGALTVIGADSFSFSCHDFTQEDLTRARHRNELHKCDEKYLHIDYKMRGLGSHSCGPNPEECYELHPHSFRFVFGICGEEDPEAALALTRSAFCVQTEQLTEKHTFVIERQAAGIIECDINRT